jgi:uncharacterized protein YjiS (DUF1127 family)
MTIREAVRKARRVYAGGKGSLFVLLVALLGAALVPAACGRREKWERYRKERAALAETSAELHSRLLALLVRQMPPDMTPWLDVDEAVGGGSIQDLHEMSERLLEDQERQIQALRAEIAFMEEKIEESRKVPIPFDSPEDMFTRSSDLYFELKRVEYLKWRRP